MTDPSEKEMLEWLKEEGAKLSDIVYQNGLIAQTRSLTPEEERRKRSLYYKLEIIQTIRRLIEERGEWGKKAGDILSDTPRLYLAVLDHEDIMDLLKEIRNFDFGKGKKR